MSVYITLSKGQLALIDDVDADWLAQWKWYLNKGGYAQRHRPRTEPGSRAIHMHRVVLERKLGHPIPEGYQADHINGDRLDNRRENLRLASAADNTHNSAKPRTNTSGYKGVHLFRQTNRWQVYIAINGKWLHLGYYDDLIIAARVYDAAARRYFGEFARPNFPDQPTTSETEKLLDDALNHQFSSRYIGVSWRPDNQRWRAYVKVNGRLKSLGNFDTQEEAARARDRAAKAIFGDAVVLNFPDEDDSAARTEAPVPLRAKYTSACSSAVWTRLSTAATDTSGSRLLVGG